MVGRFTPGVLTYSAVVRCQCGAGLAFGADVPYWRCGALLDSEGFVNAPRKGHSHPKSVASGAIAVETSELSTRPL